MMSMDEVKRITSNDDFKDCTKIENLVHCFAEEHELYMHANYKEPFHEMRIFLSPKKYWAWKRDFLEKVLSILSHIKITGMVPDIKWDTMMLTMITVNLKGVVVDKHSNVVDTTFSIIKNHLIERYDLKEDDDMRADMTGAFYEAVLTADFAREGTHDYTRHFTYSRYPEIDKVIYNDPATIVFWKDGTKTVVKAQDCVFDPAVGLAMCFIKKTIGLKEFFKHLPKETEEGP